ncbi:flagellar hook-length control protein FliK [Halomonas sp. Bachu 37]|uniref:flagellar hook-length control protein FliK n=1 Tax=Halomonas kashgarensis TaxID=3084920 RepID=UPI00321761B0
MSGITPLLDTLLHQVLGRNPSAPRLLNEPVNPIPPGEGPRAAHSDSRLEGRNAALLPPALQRSGLPAEGARPLPPGEGSPVPPGSTQTHFSPAARSIADVLLRFPAPPSAIRPQAPLMQAGEAASTNTLAGRMEGSIRDSGLFYESHLNRWYHGQTPRQQLLREPQMMHVGRFASPGTAQASAPAPVTSSAAPLAAAAPLSSSAPLPGSHPVPPGALPQGGSNTQGPPIVPNTPLIPADRPATMLPAGPQPPAAASPPNPTGPEAAQVRNAEAAGREALLEGLASSRKSREPVPEALQGVVRQQLEMLVTPAIRWEGDVWAGIFMALVINLPPRREESEGERHQETQDDWRSDMQLDVPGLGEFSISLWLHRQVLSLDMSTPVAETHQRLEAGLEQLQQRLEALDLRKVQLRARLIALEEDNDVTT